MHPWRERLGRWFTPIARRSPLPPNAITVASLLLNLIATWLLVAGGLTYTLGTVFYVMKRVRYMHAIWHCFVLGGSIFHFLAVAIYVVGSRG